MANRTVVPFGPQHPALPEPIHLDLVLEDETVVEAIPSIGFVHRGLEKLVERKDFIEYVYVAERVCGICSFLHGLGYCMAVEDIMKAEVPERASYLRVFWGELSRIHSHLMWAGLVADVLGFENLFMHCWRLRELALDIFDMTTGGRVIFSVCKIGGVRRDIPDEMMKRALDILDRIEDGLGEIERVFLRDSSVRHRLKGVGVLTRQDAIDLGAVGPMARASGLELDMRHLGYCAYPHLQFEIPTEEEGDCYARVALRLREVRDAIGLMRQCAAQSAAGGPIDTKITGNPDGESFVRLEQPRGEVVYYARGNGTKYLNRFRLRTPTFANLPSLLHMLKGCQLADVSLLVAIIDPCISCAER